MTARRSLLVLVALSAPVTAYFATRGSGDDDATASRPEKKLQKPKDGAVDEGPKPSQSDVASKAASPTPQVHTTLKPVTDAAPVEFNFPEDAGGQLLSRRLTPPAVLPPDRTLAPKPRHTPRAIENPILPASKQVASVPQLDAEPKRRPALPQFVVPEQTLDGYELHGGLPQALQFPVGDRLKVPSVSVEQPIELPLMAQPLPDKAAASDPTIPASRDAVLTAKMPARTAPAPFMIFGTPDPFEHHEAVKLREAFGTDIVPPTTGSQTPRK